jgi:hypothetical protein
MVWFQSDDKRMGVTYLDKIYGVTGERRMGVGVGMGVGFTCLSVH